MSAILVCCFSFATGKHDEMNLVCKVSKVTRIKNVPLSAEWTVNYSRSFIVNKTSPHQFPAYESVRRQRIAFVRTKREPNGWTPGLCHISPTPGCCTMDLGSTCSCSSVTASKFLFFTACTSFLADVFFLAAQWLASFTKFHQIQYKKT